MNSQPYTGIDVLYKRFYRKAFLFTKSYVRDTVIAEDIASETLLRLWQEMRTQDILHPQAFLLTMLRYKVLDFLKHEAIKREVLEEIKEIQEEELQLRISLLEACDPDEIFTAEIQQILKDTLKQFPEQTRRIFKMSRMENKSNKEIAEIIGVTTKAVEYHITKVLKTLRVKLKDYLPLFYFYFFFQ